MLAFDERPPLLPQADAQRLVPRQASDRIGEGGRVVRRHEQPGLPVAHQLGNAGDRAADHRSPAGERLHEDRRDAVHVPGAVLPAWHDEHVMRLHLARDLLLGHRGGQADVLAERRARDLVGDPLAQRPVAVEAQPECEPAGAQQHAGVEQRVEPLLLEEAGDAQEADATVAPRGRLDAEEIGGNADVGHRHRRAALRRPAAAQQGGSELAHGEGMGGVRELPRQGLVPPLAAGRVDVEGMGGERERNVRYRARDRRTVGTLVGEVGV